MAALSLIQSNDEELNDRGFPLPQFPSHNEPRTWFLTCADSAIGIALTRQLLEHGDKVVAAASSARFGQSEKYSLDFQELMEEVNNIEEWKLSFMVLPLNPR